MLRLFLMVCLYRWRCVWHTHPQHCHAWSGSKSTTATIAQSWLTSVAYSGCTSCTSVQARGVVLHDAEQLHTPNGQYNCKENEHLKQVQHNVRDLMCNAYIRTGLSESSESVSFP
jgi:hypothetical protein